MKMSFILLSILLMFSFAGTANATNLPELPCLIGCEGPPGPQGPKGDKGDKGDQGDQGVAGVDGANGENGENGANGLTGVDGQDFVFDERDYNGLNALGMTDLHYNLNVSGWQYSIGAGFVEGSSGQAIRAGLGRQMSPKTFLDFSVGTSASGSNAGTVTFSGQF